MLKAAVMKQIQKNEKFEEALNEWLSQHPKVKIVSTALDNFTLVIFYEE